MVDYTVKTGALNSLYLDIPIYYRSQIDEKIESTIMSIMRTYSKECISTPEIDDLFEHSRQFLFNYVASKLDGDESFKTKTLASMPRRNMLSIFSQSTIYEILSFYCEVTNSFLVENNYKRDVEQAKLAFACFNLLSAYSKKFILLMNESIRLYLVSKHTIYQSNTILFNVSDAELRNDFYIDWLSTLESSMITKIGLKIHNSLLSYTKEIKAYQDKYENNAYTDSDMKQMVELTTSLLNSAEYLCAYVEADSAVKALDLCRKISTDLRVVERALRLPEYTIESTEQVESIIYIELTSSEKASKKKGSLGLNLSIDTYIGLNNRAHLTINTLDKNVTLDLKDLEEDTELWSVLDKQLTISNMQKLCELCRKTLNSFTFNTTYDRAIYAVLVIIPMMRRIIEIESFDKAPIDVCDLYTTLQSILCYSEQSEDTSYVARATNGLIEEFKEPSVQYAVQSLVSEQFALAHIKAMLDHVNNQKSANYLHNRLYNVLKITDNAFYQPYIKTYDLINIEDVLATSNKYEVIKAHKEKIEQNILILFIADNLFWLDEYLDDIDCDCNVFDAYERGMQAVYEKYAYMKPFFKTFYSFYIVGVIAYILNDASIPLQVLSSNDRFNVDNIAKKLRRFIINKQQQKEQEERRKELEAKAKEREAKRIAEEQEKQRLEAERKIEEEKAAAIEREREKNFNDANAIMEALNKKAWVGFTIPQQQAAYIRHLQEGNDPLTAANLVKEEFVHRQEEENAIFAMWEQEAKEEERLKQLEAEAEKEKQRLAEEARKKKEQLAYKALCDKADQQYADMTAGRAIFVNPLLSVEEQKTAPLLNIYEIAKLVGDLTSATKLMQLVYDAPGDALSTDIVSAEILRLLEIKKNQVIDPIDKEVMVSARALANKHCVPYKRFKRLTELGMPVQQALIIPKDRLVILAKLYNADKIVHDKSGKYIVCKGEYILPVTFNELRELYIRYKKMKGGK